MFSSVIGMYFSRKRCFIDENLHLLHSGVGKTCLAMTYINNKFPDKDPTQSFYDCRYLVVNRMPIALDLVDAGTKKEFESLRSVHYPGTDVFIICFSLVDVTSFLNVRQKWLPEIIEFEKSCPSSDRKKGIPIILAGLKSDLRTFGSKRLIKQLERRGPSSVSWSKGQECGRRISAVKYVECSSKQNSGVKNVFDEAVKAVITRRRRKKKRSSVLSCCIIL